MWLKGKPINQKCTYRKSSNKPPGGGGVICKNEFLGAGLFEGGLFEGGLFEGGFFEDLRILNNALGL